MGASTAISWSDSTWTPLRARVKQDAAAIAEQKGYGSLVQIAKDMAGRVGPHCEKASAGCQNCYSETNNARCLPRNGTGLPFDRRSRDLVDIHLDEKILLQPLRWKKGRRIFVCSQTDLFGEFVPDELIDRVFAVMALCPQHTFQVLTKRADRMAAYLAERWIVPGSVCEWDGALAQVHKSIVAMLPTLPARLLNAISSRLDAKYPDSEGEGFLRRWPLPNVWLGVSVEDQRRADERIPHLLRTPAGVRFLSCEPLLEDLRLWKLASLDYHQNTIGYETYPLSGMQAMPDCDWPHPKIDWVIVGAESGPGARPCSEDWIRSLRDQCQTAGTAFFYKQWAANGRRVDTPELDGKRWVEFPEVAR